MKDEPLYRPLPDSFDARYPVPEAPAPRTRSWGVAFRAAVYLAIAGVILVGIVPKFSQVYRQTKVPMPAVTESLLRLGDAVSAYRWGAYAAILLAPAFLTRLNRRAAARAELAMLALFVLGLLVVIVALFLPLVGTLEGIGPKKCY